MTRKEFIKRMSNIKMRMLNDARHELYRGCCGYIEMEFREYISIYKENDDILDLFSDLMSFNTDVYWYPLTRNNVSKRLKLLNFFKQFILDTKWYLYIDT